MQHAQLLIREDSLDILINNAGTAGSLRAALLCCACCCGYYKFLAYDSPIFAV